MFTGIGGAFSAGAVPCSSALILQARCRFSWLALAAQFPVAKYQKENAVSAGPLLPWPLSFGLLSGKTTSLPRALPSSPCHCGAVGSDGSHLWTSQVGALPTSKDRHPCFLFQMLLRTNAKSFSSRSCGSAACFSTSSPTPSAT